LSGGSGGISSSSQATTYTYDPAGNLTKVVQGVQTRIFAYDGLGRKISETTPEAGTVTASYTTAGGSLCSGDPGNVCVRTDARGVVTTYTYDHANRLTGKTYTIPSGHNIAAMPNVCTTSPNGTSANVCYYYDAGGAGSYALGRLTSMSDPSGSETSKYDQDGRITQVTKVIGSQTFITSWLHNAAGEATHITYPSGRVVVQTYDNVGQLCATAPTSTSCTSTSNTYQNSITYDPFGNQTTFNYGNGVSSSRSYSAAREQLSTLSYSFGSQTYFSVNYYYQQNSTYCPAGTSGNNGNIECIADGVSSGRSSSYVYDSLTRLSSASTSGSTAYPKWGLSESYDRYGNRLQQQVTAGSAPSSSLTFTNSGGGNTNQSVGYTYDASGNMITTPPNPTSNYEYDGDNQLTNFTGSGESATYTYDGNGFRVQKSVAGGTSTVSVFDGSAEIAEYDNGQRPEVHRGSLYSVATR
jgi:YD repeat-containing protein